MSTRGTTLRWTAYRVPFGTRNDYHSSNNLMGDAGG